jgi:hypothetical protein
MHDVPKLMPDGNWKPGEWLQFGTGNRPGDKLWVTNNPTWWLHLTNPPKVYEVQLGDAPSIDFWNQIGGHHNFAAYKIRLIRPLDYSELRAFPDNRLRDSGTGKLWKAHMYTKDSPLGEW